MPPISLWSGLAYFLYTVQHILFPWFVVLYPAKDSHRIYPKCSFHFRWKWEDAFEAQRWMVFACWRWLWQLRWLPLPQFPFWSSPIALRSPRLHWWFFVQFAVGCRLETLTSESESTNCHTPWMICRATPIRARVQWFCHTQIVATLFAHYCRLESSAIRQQFFSFATSGSHGTLSSWELLVDCWRSVFSSSFASFVWRSSSFSLSPLRLSWQPWSCCLMICLHSRSSTGWAASLVRTAGRDVFVTAVIVNGATMWGFNMWSSAASLTRFNLDQGASHFQCTLLGWI